MLSHPSWYGFFYLVPRISFDWFLFCHSEESSSSTDHSGGLFVWKRVMFRYERVILDLTITNQYILTTEKEACIQTLCRWITNKKVKLGWRVEETSVAVKSLRENKLLVNFSKTTTLKNYVQNLIKGTKHLTDLSNNKYIIFFKTLDQSESYGVC